MKDFICSVILSNLEILKTFIFQIWIYYKAIMLGRIFIDIQIWTYIKKHDKILYPNVQNIQM